MNREQRTPEATPPQAVSGPARLVLPAEIDAAGVSDLHRVLLPPCTAEAPVVVDGSAVERIDTAGLQLLTALAEDLRRRGGGLEWSGASDRLRDAARALGLEAVLALPAAQTPS